MGGGITTDHPEGKVNQALISENGFLHDVFGSNEATAHPTVDRFNDVGRLHHVQNQRMLELEWLPGFDHAGETAVKAGYQDFPWLNW